MAGIYIHIPFCRHKCNYCNFYSLASVKYMDQIPNAVMRELHQRKEYLEKELVETIYFGGGTPSMLKATEIEEILDTVRTCFNVDAHSEITLETNPDDLTPENLKAFKSAGVNRLSIGIQSFRQDDLDFLSRTHSSLQVIQCITDAQQAGFQNLSIDLIYGIPTLTDNGWKQNLEKAFSLGIPHISAYSLTVEEKTPLAFMIRTGKSKAVDENLSIAHYHILTQMMQRQGYEHYEVSNFCKPGAYSRHNKSYWQGIPYLGAGPSAHSFNGTTRSWNIANISRYIDSVASGSVDRETEVLSPITQLNEYVMTSLRTIWGCDLVWVKQKYGEQNAENLMNNALPFLESDQMIYQKGKLLLTPAGRLFTDGIASSLFTDSD